MSPTSNPEELETSGIMWEASDNNKLGVKKIDCIARNLYMNI
jgi:hypothetical protein